MAKYQENLYSIDRALQEIGKGFMEQHFLELQEFAEDNSKNEIKERLYREAAKDNITMGGVDVRLAWAIAIFEHNDWDKVPVPKYIEKVRNIIEAYKDDFASVDKDERYKWKALNTYKKIWNINAENFAPMLKSAYRDSFNLLQSGNYYPYKVICEFAENQPEKARQAFRILFNEEKAFAERYDEFRKIFEDYFQPLGKSHYQDLHAISVYLLFEYPDKYYIYKYGILKSYIKNTEWNCGSIDKLSDAEKMELNSKLSTQVLACIKEDDEIIEMHRERLDDKCYFDEELHLLTQDVMYYGSKAKVEEQWYPTLDEYNPNLSKEDWKKFILDIEKPNHRLPIKMLKAMMELGGTASCKQLATIYGGNTSSYIGSTVNLGKRAKKYFDLPTCMDGDQERFFIYPFFGKAVDDETGHSYLYKIRPELMEALNELDLTDVNPMYEEDESTVSKTDISKNTILYGPPGTGKTYSTVQYAVAIIENKTLNQVKEEPYEDILKRFNTYKEAKQIETTTFHQSYGYEEFIEGIKPVHDVEDEDDSDIQYKVMPGIFKSFCERATIPTAKKDKDLGLNSSPTIWKVSLEGTGTNPTRDECMLNNHIRIGFDEYGPNITPETDFSDYGGKNVLNAFFYKMKKGDIVLTCFSNTSIDAVGVITGDADWDDSYEYFKRIRKVKWLVKGINEDIVEANGGATMAMMTIYQLSISLADVMEIVRKNQQGDVVKPNDNNYVFIIDEINRGNISKIFGELITLIEPSKRIGMPEAATVKLSYSPLKEFGVPANVYLIGTMNTADRSIASIDTALRRRFQFREMQPEADVLEGIIVEGISVKDMLLKMNKKISVLYDREHTIGHAYFLPLKEIPTIDMLAEIFKNNILPLLQEYFYDDYQRIQLVLGDNKKTDDAKKFIIEESYDWNTLFGSTDFDEDAAVTYSVNNRAFYDADAYRFI